MFATATVESPTEKVISPDGQYIAQIWHWGVFDATSKRPTIDVLDKHGSVLWQVPYQGDVATFMPRPHLNIYGWSPDSADLYFYYSWRPDGGIYAFVWTGYDLQKIHIADGHIERVLPGEHMMSFAFSPDGTQIAYSGLENPPRFLYVRTLLTGAEKRTSLTGSLDDGSMVGNMHWSPDNKRIAFQTQAIDFTVETFYLDVARMKPKLVKVYKAQETNGDGYVALDGWTMDNRLQFYEYPSVVALDPVNNATVVIGTPTPEP